MKRSLDEKYRYNSNIVRKSIKTFADVLKPNNNPKIDFSEGYVFGVDLYTSYSYATKAKKKEIKKMFSNEMENARKGSSFAKGVICAYRDASSARKSKKQ